MWYQLILAELDVLCKVLRRLWCVGVGGMRGQRANGVDSCGDVVYTMWRRQLDKHNVHTNVYTTH